MSEPTPESHDPADELPGGCGEFERQLGEIPFAAGLSAARRDRLMYESGYAAASQACDAVAAKRDQVIRRTLGRWRAVALGLAALWAFLVGLPLWQASDARRPSAGMAEQEPVHEQTGQNAGPTRATVWPGMSPDLAQVTPQPVLSPRITSIRSQWSDDKAVPWSWPTPADVRPGQAVTPPLRASDSRRFLESI